MSLQWNGQANQVVNFLESRHYYDSSYYFFQINRWDLVTNNKKIIKFPSKDLNEAIKLAGTLLNNKDFNKYTIIDLRINNKIITQ